MSVNKRENRSDKNVLRLPERSRWVKAILAFLICTLVTAGTAPILAEDYQAPDFTLTDQFGTEHTLSAYKEKVVFLNFWTTWCPYCVQEMPEIEDLYHELGENRENVIILGIGAPNSYDTVDEKGISDFLEQHGWTYPVLMDKTGKIFEIYGAQSLPTTWLIRADGNLMGYVPGAMDKETMMNLIRQTQDYGKD